MLLTVFLILLLIFYMYYKYLLMKNYWLKKGVPYITPLPFLGNMSPSLSWNGSIVDFVINMYNTHPTKRYIGFHQFHQPTLLIRDPELIKTIMVKEFTSFSDHSMFNRGICEPYEGLFFIPANRGWHNIRSILSPAFTNSKLKHMLKLVDECGNFFVDYCKKQGSVPIDLKDSFSRYTNDSIVTTAFGIKCESFKNKDNFVFTMGKKLVDFSGIKGLKAFAYNISPFFTKLLNVQIVTQRTGKIFANIVEDTLKVRKEQNIVRPDMINLMLENKSKAHCNVSNGFNPGLKLDLTNEDIIAAAISFYFAGFDTTSTSLTYMAYALGVNPEVQEKLRQEVDEVMYRSNGQLTFEEITNLKYLEMVISESLRKWNAAPFLDRLCVKSFTIESVTPEEKPIKIDAGTSIWVSVCGLHHDPKYYEDPEKFDPERFNEENKAKRHQFAYIPFGGGPRTCLGSRYALFVCKLILIKLVHNFELVPCDKTQIPLKNGGGVSILPEEGVWLIFKPR